MINVLLKRGQLNFDVFESIIFGESFSLIVYITLET